MVEAAERKEGETAPNEIMEATVTGWKGFPVSALIRFQPRSSQSERFLSQTRRIYKLNWSKKRRPGGSGHSVYGPESDKQTPLGI